MIAWYNVPLGLTMLFYALEFALMSVIVTNIFQYAKWLNAGRRKRHKKKVREAETALARDDTTRNKRKLEKVLKSPFAPDDGAVRIIFWSIPLNLLMPFLVCVIYIGGYGYPEYKIWENGSWYPNTTFGIALWIMKYVGFIMLSVGLIRITNMLTKSKQRWRKIRSGEFREEQEAKKAAKKQKSLEKEGKDSPV